MPISAIVNCCMQHVQDPQCVQRALNALKDQYGRVKINRLIITNSILELQDAEKTIAAEQTVKLTS